jgi:hypothetical protein
MNVIPAQAGIPDALMRGGASEAGAPARRLNRQLFTTHQGFLPAQE